MLKLVTIDIISGELCLSGITPTQVMRIQKNDEALGGKEGKACASLGGLIVLCRIKTLEWRVNTSYLTFGRDTLYNYI